MSWLRFFFVLVGVVGLLGPESSWARPEYSVRMKINCAGCHWNPAGGGPRTVMGKSYGSRNLGFAKTSEQDWYYADVRGFYFSPEKPKERASGLVLMKASASLNVVVLEKDAKKTRFIVSRDFSPLTIVQTREAFAMWETGNTGSFAPEHILFGRFYLPFGYLTDEHRTYTRIQTHTTYRDFDMGIMASGSPSQTFHYDLALTAGQGTGSNQGFSSDDTPYRLTGNFRFNPMTDPLMVGFSILHQSTETKKPKGYAGSFYGVFALDKVRETLPKLSLGLEAVLADQFNRSDFNGLLTAYFDGGTTFNDAIADRKSLGLLAEVKWETSDKWVLSYKFDQLTLDKNFPGDRFMRHGLGFTYFLDSNTSIKVRGERGIVKREDIDPEGIRGGRDAYWAQFRIWL